MSTSQHTVPASTYDKNAAHHNDHTKDEFAGTRGTTSSADNLRNDGLVKTGGYTTGLEAAHGTAAPSGHAVPVTAYNQNVIGGTPITNQPTAGAQLQNTVPNAANRDGLVVNDGIGGARGGAAILGGQCECTMNGGHCAHGAGNCVCRGCTTKATTINPGINIGVSTTQYTAPAGTTGIGGGVMERGTGIAGLVHADNTATRPVDAAHEHCECVKKNGSCGCAPGTCACTNCSALRTAQAAKAKAAAEKDKHSHSTHHHDAKDSHHHAHATTHAHPVAAATTSSAAHVSAHSTNIDGDGRQPTHFGQGTTVGAPSTITANK